MTSSGPALHRCACGHRGLVIVDNGQADSGQRGLVVMGDGQADSGQRGLLL